MQFREHTIRRKIAFRFALRRLAKEKPEHADVLNRVLVDNELFTEVFSSLATYIALVDDSNTPILDFIRDLGNWLLENIDEIIRIIMTIIGLF